MLRFACLALAVFLSGCVEQSNDYITVTVDGKPMEFKVKANAQVAGDNGLIENVVFGAQSSEDESKPTISITVETLDRNIVPGVPYLDGLETGDDPVLARYYWQESDGTFMHTSNSDVGLFTLQFMRVDRQRVEGTFSGKVKHLDPDIVVSLTDGRFSLPVLH